MIAVSKLKTEEVEPVKIGFWNRQRGSPCSLLNEAILDEATIVRLTKPKEDDARRSAYAWTTS